MRLYALLIVFLSSSPVLAAVDVDYTRDVRPILGQNCFQCHGPDEATRAAGLRLDQRETAMAERRNGAVAIVPGKPDQSELLLRITEDDPSHRMPPQSSKKSLNSDQLATLRTWIEQGAPYQQHWSFVSPTRPPVPVTPNHWANGPIDRFIQARLNANGLQPSDETDRQTWIRRTSLDLIGLPPTITEVDRFHMNADPDAHQKVVDRLFASPRFGERWGLIWLDLARYADSAGYAQDPMRVIWRYRDWVIDTINSGMPFDQFTIEQIAGDMLPDPREDQLIATAFHRNTMTNSEGGTNDEEFRNAAVVDRVNTTMQVWMGMTMSCAQCHSHKYDPISHREYFEVFSIFNNTADADRGDESPNLARFTSEQELQRAELQAQITQLERVVAAKQPTSKIPEPTGPLKARFLRVELLGQQKILHLAEVQAFAGETNVARHGKASQSSTGYDAPARLAIDGDTNGDFFKKSVSHTGQEADPWWEVDLVRPVVLDRVVVWNRTDGNTASRLNPFRVVLLDEKRRPLWIKQFRQAPPERAEMEPPSSTEALTDQDRELIRGYAAYLKPDSPDQKRLNTLKKQLDEIKPVPTPIMQELPEGKRRTTKIQLRGDYQITGEEVTPGVPTVFPPMPEGVEVNRLTLARWLVAPENPLTARVTVNRHWEEIFGIGIVETSEDFGTQGELPTHPELLDWLAVELMDSGWDTKRLLRELVLSSTYRQSSDVTPTLLEHDPRNELLSRGPRFRLSAETIRDQALAVGGLLSSKMNGPSVRPPQPKLGLRSAFGGSTDWDPSPGEDRFRRGLYTTWRRTTPYPSMLTFDATSREVCTIRRIRTNTPLQALVTLNDPVYVEAAQGLARRVLREGGETLSDRLMYAMRLCVSRPASERELDRLEELHAELIEKYRADPEAARKMATEPLGPPPSGVDVAELAAWTVIGNVLMNLDEFLARR